MKESIRMKKHFDFTFQLWEYKVSHGSLLIRCPKTYTGDKNIDIIFVGVDYIELPSIFRGGIEIVDPNYAELSRASDVIGAPVADPRVVTILRSGNRRYMVIACAPVVQYSTMDYMESPFT